MTKPIAIDLPGYEALSASWETDPAAAHAQISAEIRRVWNALDAENSAEARRRFLTLMRAGLDGWAAWASARGNEELAAMIAVLHRLIDEGIDKRFDSA